MFIEGQRLQSRMNFHYCEFALSTRARQMDDQRDVTYHTCPSEMGEGCTVAKHFGVCM